MSHPVPRKHFLPTLLLLLALSPLAPAGVPAPTPVPFMRTSISSIDAFNSLLTQLHLPFPFDLQSAIEKNFPFIGDNGTDTAKPIGIVYLAGQNLPTSSMAFFVLPVKPDAASFDSLLLKSGATLNPAHPDIAQIAPASGPLLNFKRTDNYLFMYPGPVEVLENLTDTYLTSDYTNKDTLAIIDIDPAAIRQNAPDLWKKILAGFQTGAPNADTFEGRVKRGYIDYISQVTHLNLTLSHPDNKTDTLHLAASITPALLTATANHYKTPVFPADAFLTAHLLNTPEIRAKEIALFNSLKKEIFLPSTQKLTPDQQTQFTIACENLFRLILDTPEQSFAITLIDGQPAFLLVNQYDAPPHFLKNAEDNFQTLLSLAPALGEKGPQPTLEHFTTDRGDPALNILFPAPDNSFVTLIEHDTTILIAITRARPSALPLITFDAKHKLPSNILSATLDFNAFFKALPHLQGLYNDLRLTPESISSLEQSLADKSLTLTLKTTPSANSLTLDLDLPTPLLEQLIPLLTH